MKKKLVITIMIVTATLVIVVATAVGVRNSIKDINTSTNIESNLVIQEAEGLKFKGKSTIKNEQSIVLDKTQGEINKVYVQDGQRVTKDTILFDYYNTNIQEEVSGLNRQIETMNTKIQNEKNRLNKLSEEEKAVTGGDSTLLDLKTNLSEIVSKRDALNEKVIKPIKAELDGIVYFSAENVEHEYMKVVSEESLIIAEASEFDVNELAIDRVVDIKVISTSQIIKGKITKIDEIPTVSSDQKSVVYKFQIKPEEKIKIGFSVEIDLPEENLLIPESYVIKEDSKLYVDIISGEEVNRKEINAILKDGIYEIQDDTVKVGDIIKKVPLEDKEEK